MRDDLVRAIRRQAPSLIFGSASLVLGAMALVAFALADGPKPDAVAARVLLATVGSCALGLTALAYALVQIRAAMETGGSLTWR